ncbi:hypothetical protein FKP32DRAFT_1560237 [Trametes sanguinea]|nr:hypothetical protein FKP32DRAFT_1560237 [Trametes sanguinea]
MLSLLSWRQTCRSSYKLATACLLVDRHYAVKPYTSDTAALWGLFREHRALVGGEVALRYVLRDFTPHHYTLEVYVPMSASEAFLMDIDLTMGLDWEFIRDRHASDEERAKYFFSDIHHYRARGGRQIAVYIATSEAAAQPLVTTWSTSFVNYLGAETFGVGYPSLTLRHRALAPPREQLARNSRRVFDELQTKLGFDFALDALTWPQYASPTAPSSCARDQFLCLLQARFFGDAGSLVVAYETMTTSTTSLADNHHLPYGVSTIWRMSCDLGSGHWCPCRARESKLPGHLYSVPCVIVQSSALTKTELPFTGFSTMYA